MLFNKATVFFNSSLCNWAVKWTVQSGLCYEVASKKVQRIEVNILPFIYRMHVRAVFCLYKYFHLQRILQLQQCSYWSCSAGAALPKQQCPGPECSRGMGQPGKTIPADTTQPPGAHSVLEMGTAPQQHKICKQPHFFLKKYFPWWFGGIFCLVSKEYALLVLLHLNGSFLFSNLLIFLPSHQIFFSPEFKGSCSLCGLAG